MSAPFRSAVTRSRGTTAALVVAGLLAGFGLAAATVQVAMDLVPDGSRFWVWSFLLNVAALVVWGAVCLIRRDRWRPFGGALLIGWLLPMTTLLVVGFLVGQAFRDAGFG